MTIRVMVDLDIDDIDMGDILEALDKQEVADYYNLYTPEEYGGLEEELCETIQDLEDTVEDLTKKLEMAIGNV